MSAIQSLNSRDPLVVDPGELRHPVVIQQPADTPVGASGMSVVPATWNTVRTTKGAIYTAGGRETSMASQLVSEVSHVVKVRWTSTVIKANYRVLFGGRFFTVSAVENVLERNRILLLYCLEINGGGQ